MAPSILQLIKKMSRQTRAAKLVAQELDFDSRSRALRKRVSHLVAERVISPYVVLEMDVIAGCFDCRNQICEFLIAVRVYFYVVVSREH